MWPSTLYARLERLAAVAGLALGHPIAVAPLKVLVRVVTFPTLRLGQATVQCEKDGYQRRPQEGTALISSWSCRVARHTLRATPNIGT
jgi:hypothetical protein